MTGDNNGRWAGSYDWPLDQAAYLANAASALRRLRPHPSLLLVGGGNELSPRAASPPPAVGQVRSTRGAGQPRSPAEGQRRLGPTMVATPRRPLSRSSPPPTTSAVAPF